MSTRALRWAFGLFELVDVPPAQRNVLLALCWDHTDKDGCYTSQARLALLSGYRERRVREILNDLEATGLIKRKRVKSAGKWSHTSYQLFGTTGRRGPVEKGKHHRHCGAGRNHRQTGADYRGTNKGQSLPELRVLKGGAQ